ALGGGAAVGGVVLGPEQLVPVVVAVGPSLGQSALALLGQVPFRIPSIRPGAVGLQLVSGRGVVAGVRPVARAVVTPAVRPIIGQLVGGVVGEGLRRPVEDLGLDAAARVVGVGVIRVEGAAAVAVLERAQPVDGIVAVAGAPDLRIRVEVTVPRGGG